MIARERRSARACSHATRGGTRVALFVAAAGVQLALAGCSELPSGPDPESTAAAPADTPIEASAALIGTSMYTAEYAWSKGKLATPLGSTSSRVCFLTHVGGSFQARGDWVGVVASGGTWYLTGTSSTGHVYAGARCLLVSQYTAEVRVSGGNAVTGRAVLPARSCGLTRVGGTFNGGLDGIRIHDDRSFTAHSEFGYVEAAARCALGDIVASGLEYSWYYSSGPILMQTASGRLCVLTAMIGVFESSADLILTYPSNGYWYLSGSPTHGSDRAAGRCMRKNPRV
jgi:hypothetical protein